MSQDTDETIEPGLRHCGCTLDTNGRQVDMCSFHLGQMLDRAEKAAKSATLPKKEVWPAIEKIRLAWAEFCDGCNFHPGSTAEAQAYHLDQAIQEAMVNIGSSDRDTKDNP